MRKILNSLAAYLLIAFSVSAFSGVGLTQAAFGVSPPWIQNDLLLPGTTLEEVIYLSRSDADQAMQAKVRLDGDEELQRWMSIQNQENLIMQEGQQIFPMTVVIQVPQSAELGEYKGGIFVTLIPVTEEKMGGGQVAIALGVHIAVDLTVVDEEVTDYEVKSSAVEPIKPNEPFKVNVEVTNTGNTDVGEVEGQIEVYDRATDESVKTLAFASPDEPVAFNETKDVEMVYEDFKPEAGEYWVEVTASKDGQTIYENRMMQRVQEEPIPVITPEDVLGSTTPTTEDKKGAFYLMLGLAGLILVLFVVVGTLAAPLLHKRKKKSRL